MKVPDSNSSLTPNFDPGTFTRIDRGKPKPYFYTYIAS